jgi:hypothetical protein
MTTAEAGAFILSSEYRGGGFEDFTKWMSKLALDVWKAAMFKALELVDQFGGLDDIPPEVWDEYALKATRAMLWQVGMRDEKPD